MPAHQYVQHERSPALWAVLLLILAVMVVADARTARSS